MFYFSKVVFVFLLSFHFIYISFYTLYGLASISNKVPICLKNIFHNFLLYILYIFLILQNILNCKLNTQDLFLLLFHNFYQIRIVYSSNSNNLCLLTSKNLMHILDNFNSHHSIRNFLIVFPL